MSDFWGKVRRGTHPISLWRLLDYLTGPSVRTGWNKSSSREPSCNIIMLVRVGARIFSPLLLNSCADKSRDPPPFQSIIESSATLWQSQRWLIGKDKTPKAETCSEQMTGKQSYYNQTKDFQSWTFPSECFSFCLCYLLSLGSIKPEIQCCPLAVSASVCRASGDENSPSEAPNLCLFMKGSIKYEYVTESSC